MSFTSQFLGALAVAALFALLMLRANAAEKARWRAQAARSLTEGLATHLRPSEAPRGHYDWKHDPDA